MKRLLTVFLAVGLILLMLVGPAAAETVRKDGLEATLATDKELYLETDPVVVTLSVENTGTVAVRNVIMSIPLPKGYAFEDGSQGSKMVTSLGAGKSATLVATLRNSQTVAPDVPKTGDNAHLNLWMALLCVSLAAIVSLAAWSRRGGRFMSLLLCMVLASSVMPGSLRSARADSATALRGSIELQRTVHVGAEELVLNGQVSYEYEVAYTRAEWVAKVIDLMGFGAFHENEPSFTDIAGTPYEDAIETAVVHQMLTAGGAFEPDAPATRDFAAATLIRAMGYILEGDLECADAASIQNPKEAYLAVDLRMLSLQDGLFCPNVPINSQDAKTALARAKEINDLPYREGSGGKGVIFQSGTIELPAEAAVSDDGKVLTLASVPAGIKAGDVIVVGNAKACKVVSVSGNKITYTQPKLEDYIQEMDVYGTGYLDFANFIPAEGVTVEAYEEKSSERAKPVTLSMTGNTWEEEEDYKNIDMPDGRLPISVTLPNGLELYAQLTMENNRVHYGDKAIYHDGELQRIDEYIILETEVGVTGGLGANVSDIKSKYDRETESEKTYPLGSLPILGTPVFLDLRVNLYLVLTASGAFEIGYKTQCRLGTQVTEDHCRTWIHEGKKGQWSAGASGSMSIAGRVLLTGDMFCLPWISIGADLGASAEREGKGNWREEAAVWCADIGLYLFGEAHLMKNTVLSTWLEGKGVGTDLVFTMFHDPVLLHVHFENLWPVPECTFKDGYLDVVIYDKETMYTIPGVRVGAYARDTLQQIAVATTDRDGHVNLKVPAGDYIVMATKENYQSAQSDFMTVEEALTTSVYLGLSPVPPTPSPTPTPTPIPTPTPTPTATPKEDSDAPVTVSGVVIDELWNLPVPSAGITVYRQVDDNTISIASSHAVTDENGCFTFECEPGEYGISVYKAGYLTYNDSRADGLNFYSAEGRVFDYTFHITVTEEGIQDEIIYIMPNEGYADIWVEAQGWFSYVIAPVAEDSKRMILPNYVLDPPTVHPESSVIHAWVLDSPRCYDMHTLGKSDIIRTPPFDNDNEELILRNYFFLNHPRDGVYSFYVRYERRVPSDEPFERLGREVRVWRKNEIVETFVSPIGDPGDYYQSTIIWMWHVFDYHGATGEIIPGGEVYRVYDVPEEVAEERPDLRPTLNSFLESLR